jgi:GDPmannose 4,6-dehydratase
MLELGNMDAKRDWGYAKDYVVGMHLMLQHSKPDVFVLATGRTETVRDFVSLSCQALDIGIEWRGEGIDEVAIDQASGKEIVRVNPKFFRPAEVDLLIGDPSKAAKDLGWTAETTLEQLCSLMVDADLKRERGKV